MRAPDRPAAIAATLTLELGIDIGYLERVIQLESPPSVASFLQRLGRTGRRGEPADMRFVCTENNPSPEATLPEEIPWQLLQCIAIIQLYLEQRWIEPIKPIQYPFSLLYHQTMSILAVSGAISPANLAQQVLSLPPFSNISQEDFKLLLRYLIAINHIEVTEQQKLILGLQGEKIVGKFQFYAVFSEQEEYTVKQGKTDIGSIVLPPAVGNKFALAGQTWEVVEINFQKKIVMVKKAAGKASSFWRGGTGIIHTRILQRMQQVLRENTQYPYLQKNAIKRLQIARELARDWELTEKNIIRLAGNKCCIFPWIGTKAFRTLERLINFFVESLCKSKILTVLILIF